jgi:hypothetical protein
MTSDPCFVKIIFIFLALLTIGITVYLSFREKVIDQSESLIYFSPFIVTCGATAFLIFAYGIFEFDTIIFDPSEAFAALENHGFIPAILKFFVAGAAICIAWHRSTISIKQIDMLQNTNRMTNFYSLQKHIREAVENKKETLNSQFLEIKNTHSLFNFMFNNAYKDDYSPIIALDVGLRKLKEEFNILHMLIENTLPIVHSKYHLISKRFIYAPHIGVVHNFFLYVREIEKCPEGKFDFPYDEVNNHCHNINKFVKTIVNNFGFNLKPVRDTHFLKDPSKNAIVISELLNFLDDIVKDTPISQDYKVKFNNIFEQSVFFSSFSSNFKQIFLELPTDTISESNIT